MEATSSGQNRTGAAIHPDDVKRMMEAVSDLSPPMPISTLDIDIERQSYIAEADGVGSIPSPGALKKSSAKKGGTKLKGASPSLYLDKLGERIAFERTGARLYDALITKYLALTNAGGPSLPPPDSILGGAAADDVTGDGGVAAGNGDGPASVSGDPALDALRQIRADEMAHFRLLCDAAVTLGADPTAQTPCGDVSATASMGLMQVVTDPRTTLAQSLYAMLTAELTDNAGWELLSELGEQSGQSAMAQQFSTALAAEERHLALVKGWLRALVANEAGTAAV